MDDLRAEARRQVIWWLRQERVHEDITDDFVVEERLWPLLLALVVAKINVPVIMQLRKGLTVGTFIEMLVVGDPRSKNEDKSKIETAVIRHALPG